MKEQILDLVKGAVALNLRYSWMVLNISKEYLKDFERVVTESTRPTNNTPSPGPQEAPVRRSPILLVGRLGEEASGAFAVSNTAATELTASLTIEGEPEAKQVRISPQSISLGPGQSAIIRLGLMLTDSLAENRDYIGAVLAPGLSNQIVEFKLRRLP
jgi:hypothetical protein